MEWNPSKTATLGLEWFPTAQGSTALDAAAKIAGTSFDQTASVAIPTILVPNVGLPIRGGVFGVEVYDNENAVSDSPVITTIAPGVDVSRTGWVTQSGGTTNLFAGIDDGAYPTVNTADYVSVSGTSGTYVGRFTTATLTGKRILAVRMRVYVFVGPTGVFIPSLRIGGVDYNTGVPVGPRNAGWVTITWNYNPATRLPWTIADITALNTTNGFSLSGQTQAGVWSSVVVYNIALEVINQTETRIAVGSLDDSGGALVAGSSSSPAWNSAAMLTPTGGAWTKDGSGRHLYTVRRMSTVGAMNVPYLESYNPPSTGRAWGMSVDPTYGHVTSMGSALPRIYPFVQRVAGPTDHTDSMPYTQQLIATVSTGRNAVTEFPGTAANYGVLRFLVQCPAGASAGLDIKIKRTSDNVQFGTTYTLTTAAISAIPDLGGGWRLVQVQLASAATLTAVSHYVEFSSATVAGQPWWLSVPSSNGSGQIATFDSTTSAATINAVARNTSADIAVTIATVPNAPASFTTALGSQSVGETVNCVTAVPRADLSWATTSLGGSFARYEIQRSEDGGTTWVNIAAVSLESILSWKDYEAPRGVGVQYRIRAVRNDSAFSAWTNGSATITKPLLGGVGAYSATMYLVSNYNPAQNLAYEYRPGKDYTFGEADEQASGGVYMADFHLATNPIENRGVTAQWTFIVGADDKVPIGGGKSWTAFDPLRNLARAIIPYVCCLDHRGQRLFAQLRVPGGSEDAGGGGIDLYLADVGAVQLTATPFLVQVTS